MAPSPKIEELDEFSILQVSPTRFSVAVQLKLHKCLLFQHENDQQSGGVIDVDMVVEVQGGGDETPDRCSTASLFRFIRQFMVIRTSI